MDRMLACEAGDPSSILGESTPTTNSKIFLKTKLLIYYKYMQSCLFKEDTELFFKLHPALLQYVNCCLKIFPKIKTAEALRNSGPENVARVRAKLLERFNFCNKFSSYVKMLL